MARNGIWLLCGLLLTASPCLAGDNELSESEKRAGWKLLFDGKSAENFRGYKKDKLTDGWAVVDGALSRVKGGAGDIVTKDEYDSFELSIEYKISKGGNSGIMFHVTETEDAPWKTGPEIQVQDNRLTLYGRVNPSLPAEARLLHQEFEWGDFLRSFILSDEVDHERITAKLNHGVLEVVLPRATKTAPRRIQVNKE